MNRNRRRPLLCGLVFLLCCSLAGAASAGGWQSFHMEAGSGRNNPALDYWVFVPEGETEGLPLVLFLHGAGEKGTAALDQCLPLYIREGTLPPPDALLVVPQLPKEIWNWASAENTLLRITDQAAGDFGADPASFSLAGFSMGGMGTWNLSKIAPGKFSRVLCVCGGISTWVTPDLFTGVQLRLCTGKYDRSVRAADEKNYAESARKAGIDAQWTEYPSDHMGTASLVFTDPDLLLWLRLYTEKEEAP